MSVPKRSMISSTTPVTKAQVASQADQADPVLKVSTHYAHTMAKKKRAAASAPASFVAMKKKK